MKICIITGNRADWSGLDLLAQELASNRYDHSVDILRLGPREGDHPKCPLPAWAAGAATQQTADHIMGRRADLAVVCGDRSEILGAAVGAAVMGVPIAHICGGDRTEGSADDAYRDAITGLASLHFVSHEAARLRLIDMGVVGSTVFCTGAPATDRLIRMAPPPRGSYPHLGPGRNVIVAVHPNTAPGESPLADINAVVRALNVYVKDWGLSHPPVRFHIMSPNGDGGGGQAENILKGVVEGASRAWGDSADAVYYRNLEPDQFLALLYGADTMIGNSSAGIYEAPYFGVPVVNVGNRQGGRPMAACITTTKASAEGIADALFSALKGGRKPPEHVFGDGTACAQIAELITAAGKATRPFPRLRRL